MYYELALISVAIAGAYAGWFHMRIESVRVYGFWLLAAAGLSTLGLVKVNAVEFVQMRP